MSDIEQTSVQLLAEESDRLNGEDWQPAGGWDEGGVSAWDQEGRDYPLVLADADKAEEQSVQTLSSPLEQATSALEEPLCTAVRSISIRRRRHRDSHLQLGSHSASLLQYDSHKRLLETVFSVHSSYSGSRTPAKPLRLFKSNALSEAPDLLATAPLKPVRSLAVPGALLQFRRSSESCEDDRSC